MKKLLIALSASTIFLLPAVSYLAFGLSYEDLEALSFRLWQCAEGTSFKQCISKDYEHSSPIIRDLRDASSLDHRRIVPVEDVRIDKAIDPDELLKPSYKVRCQHDFLSSHQAFARNMWAYKCASKHRNSNEPIHQFWKLHGNVLMREVVSYNFTNVLLTLGKIKDNAQLNNPVQHLTFFRVDENTGKPTHAYTAPTDIDASCDLPVGINHFTNCKSSCYTPDQQILMSDNSEIKYIPIKEAYDRQIENIVTLDKNSSLENPNLSVKPVDHYTSEVTSTVKNTIVHFFTDIGELKVTSNHPLIDQNGFMKEARDFTKDDYLRSVKGQAVQIRKINTYTYEGKVYNVMPKLELLTNGSLNHHGQIVIAQGFLSGSNYYQNEGIKYLQRKLLQNSLKDPLQGDK